jgi:hypothetical protein
MHIIKLLCEVHNGLTGVVRSCCHPSKVRGKSNNEEENVEDLRKQKGLQQGNWVLFIMCDNACETYIFARKSCS